MGRVGREGQQDEVLDDEHGPSAGLYGCRHLKLVRLPSPRLDLVRA